MRPFGDRRASIRLEVVGELWGTLDLPEPPRVLNISRTGALIDSAQPAQRESVQAVRLVVDDEEILVSGYVRHVRSIERDGSPRYLLGVEFASPPVHLVNVVQQMAAHAEDSA